LREHGAGFVQNVWRAGAEPLPPEREEDRQGAELAAGEEQNSFAFSGLHDEERAANVGAAKVGAAKPPARRAATPENRGKLQAALDELLTCRRIIDGALRED
jgi:hypothetical protein